jgi:peptide/nickel transport system permease protein
MFQYLLKRVLIFIPTLLVISLLAFGLSKLAPGDPVELSSRGGLGDAQRDLANAERVYREKARQLGLDRPAFYCGFVPLAYPDTLYRILKRGQRETLAKLTAQHGNWAEISAYYHQINRLEHQLQALPAAHSASDALYALRSNLQQLYLAHADAKIIGLLENMAAALQRDSALASHLQPGLEALQQRYGAVTAQATPWKLLVPSIKWYGLDNQYHGWIASFLRLDFGRSYYDSRPVAHKMKDALFWTLLLNGLAVLLAYALAIPLGVFSAIWKGSFFDRASTLALFVLYSLPNFWIATILVVFFTTPEYGMDWFPSLGLRSLPDGAPFWDRFWDVGTHLVLPVFCLTYGALAFISRQMRGGLLNVIRQDYIRTAWAKGLSSRAVIWKHAFRNAIFPIITLFANIFPAVFAGSVVIEVIFNIPGMGKLTIDAIFQRDWPVVYTVLMLSAILTMVGILVADVLYALTDPRVSYSNKR